MPFSSSASPNSGNLTCNRAVAPGFPQAAILNAGTPTPTIQMSTRGLHQFTATVTVRCI